MQVRVAFLTGALTAVVGCGFGFSVSEPTIEGTTWRAVMLEGSPPAPGTEVTLQLGPGNLSGFAGCNNFTSAQLRIGSGSFQDGVPVEFGEIAADDAVCEDPAVMAMEEELLENLGVTSQLRFEDGQLILQGPQGRLQFEQLQIDG